MVQYRYKEVNMRAQDMTMEELNATIKSIEAATVMTDKQKRYLEILKKEVKKRRYEADRDYRIFIDCANRLFWRNYNKKYGRKFFPV